MEQGSKDRSVARRSLRLALKFRLFLRQESGVAMLEFAIVAIPFFMLVISIMEVGLVFWAGYELENATAVAARLVRTGQAQNSNYSVNDLRAQLCQNVVILTNCSTQLQLSVQTFPTFSAVTVPSAVDSNGVLVKNLPYSLGSSQSIQLITASYEWPLTSLFTSAMLSNLPDGNHLLQSSSVFRNEPFGT